jgi:uncharacterized metal-binding protein YceD (DUF177 family)
MLDLTNLLSGVESTIIIDEEYDVPIVDNNEILELSKIKVKGDIKQNSDDCFYTDLLCSGKMLLKDSISLEDVWYDFSFLIDENIDDINKNDENSLDILDLLWQNIVLEVPLRYSVVTDYDKYQGDGWKLVSDDEERLNNNPFSTLQINEDGSD